MSQQKPRQRGGRVLDKATPEQVMGLARNLPLTHSVLEKALEDATPGQLGFLANLFEKENASRAESKRRRLPDRPGSPRARPWTLRPGHGLVPADWGRGQLESLEFVERAEDLVLYGDVGCGKTHLAIAIGVLACRRMIPVRFFTASSLVMRLRKAKDENRLDQELKAIGRAGLVIIDELGYLPSTSTGPGSCSRPRGRLRDPQRHLHLESRVRQVGRRVRRRGHGRRGHRPHRAPRRIIRFHGESYRNRHSLMK